jgi:dipeptidase D
MSDESAFAGLEPALVWAHFSDLTGIARPPLEEEAAREHVLAWAAGNGLASEVDDAGNAVVRVAPSAGREAAPIVVLQSHLDMVCERDPESPFDPRAGRIHVVRDGDWLLAEGTTLGADNGIGVATAMAVADDQDVAHGPLELLFTVTEEQGLVGAKALAPELVTGRLLVNLDGTSDDALTIGCAGSAHTFVRLALRPVPVPEGCVGLAVALDGARGGHSGGDIARGRVNAIKALGRVLASASRTVPLRLASLDGGVSRNAIPREALATIAIATGSEPAFEEVVAIEVASLRQQYAGSDDRIAVSIEAASVPAAADPASSARALDLLTATPTGVVAMSTAAPRSVETSTSLNVATTDDEVVLTLASMTRSANPSALDEVVAALEASARLAGAEVDVVRSYPPWQPDPDSGLVAAGTRTFARLFGHEPGLEIVHGGLECAVIGEKLPGVEMLALGPSIEGPHAPGERLGISSTQRFYSLLGALLDDLSS